jgi:hypothetical protein
VGPAAGDEAAVPADDGGRLHDQEHVAEPGPVERGGQHGEDGAVGLGECRSGDLALQHEDLVAQGEDLGVPLVTGGEQPSKAGHDQPGQSRHETHGRRRYRLRHLGA